MSWRHEVELLGGDGLDLVDLLGEEGGQLGGGVLLRSKKPISCRMSDAMPSARSLAVSDEPATPLKKPANIKEPTMIAAYTANELRRLAQRAAAHRVASE